MPTIIFTLHSIKSISPGFYKVKHSTIEATNMHNRAANEVAGTTETAAELG